jgi:UDP-N-acetyl-D-mannosaminuronic acid transferase (WecB/TagA/CpsF family)
MADAKPDDPTLTTLIDTYKEADTEYKASQDRRNKAKQMARGLVDIGIGSPDQQAWINENLPKIERKRTAAEPAAGE